MYIPSLLMDEREHIKKSLQGDEEAFKLLVQQNHELVFRHCLKIVKNEEAAKDLTQETFVHAYQHLHEFRMEARFSTWLWRIAHNLSLNALRKSSHLEKEYKEEIARPSFFTPEEENEELMQKIKHVMSQLPEKQRVVFELYDLQHMPQKEIAAKLGISYGTVRSRLFYARKKIRQFLKSVSAR
jgi:RNA polymerase sigma-70 factor, ECF subfamily